MNKEQIIRMAREAGAAVGKPTPDAPEIIFTQCMDAERFAALVAAAAKAEEREACARVCEKDDSMRWSGAADAIRAREKNDTLA